MIRVGVITISDKASRGERTDESGEAIKKAVKRFEGRVVAYDIVPDEIADIVEKLKEYADEKKLELILTTGGTGFSPRDVTPEATKKVLDREAPGISEFLRREGAKKTERAILSRAVAGIRALSLIINLPGSSRGSKESLEAILEELGHGLDMLREKEH